MNEKVDIEVFRRRLQVEMEGLTPMEISALASTVHERMTEISNQNEKMADSSKLAILSAMFFAAENQKLRSAASVERMAMERKIEEMTLALRAAMSHVPAQK